MDFNKLYELTKLDGEHATERQIAKINFEVRSLFPENRRVFDDLTFGGGHLTKDEASELISALENNHHAKEYAQALLARNTLYFYLKQLKGGE
jgi:hypothetical protein